MDDNVTKNLNEELERNDWDVMFLHYLGLDHIGHVFGPQSKHVPEKLAEIDRIIQMLHEKSRKWKEKTAIFVTGDHGMKDSGGHGGSSFAETHVPLIVLNEKCFGAHVEQVDIAPTLSVLIGVDMPAGNVGKVINSFIDSFDFHLKNYILLYNSLVLNNSTKTFEESFQKAKALHHEFLITDNSSYASKASQFYEEYLLQSSEMLIKTSIEQNMDSLVVSLLLMIFCFLKVLNQTFSKRLILTDLFLVLCTLPFSSVFFNIYIVLILATIFHLTYQILKFISKNLSYNINTILSAAMVTQIMALMSSSLIEEEHQIWYFYMSTFLISKTFFCQKFSYNSLKFFMATATFRFLRSLNQTGDKWALLCDTADWFLREENHIYLQVFFLVSLFLVWLSCNHFTCNCMTVNTLNAVILCCVYIFKSTFPKNIFLGRFIWALLFLNTVIIVFKKLYFVTIWLLIASVLLRDYNIVLLPACIFISKLICDSYEDVFIKTLLHYWLGNALFFSQGHSNSLASVDVSVGYIGLEYYIPYIVILQVMCHTYALPVLSNLLLLKNCSNNARECWNTLIIWRLLRLILINFVTIIHRHHLFIWSVFAPKLLIESCHTAILLLQLFMWFVTIKLFKWYKKLFSLIQLYTINPQAYLAGAHKAATSSPLD